jgi:hypothetical protein
MYYSVLRFILIVSIEHISLIIVGDDVWLIGLSRYGCWVCNSFQYGSWLAFVDYVLAQAPGTSTIHSKFIKAKA